MEKNRKKLLKYVLTIGIVIMIFVVILTIVISNKNKKVKKENIGYAKLVENNDETYTFISNENKVYVYNGYSNMCDFYYGVTCVSKKIEQNKYFLEDAIIDFREKIIVDYGVYDSINQIAKGKYYEVEKDNLYGIVDYNGKVIIPIEYDYITISDVQNEKEYIFIGEKNEKEYDYINEKGKIMLHSDESTSLGKTLYYEKFNDKYETIISIEIGDSVRYFNLSTGEEIFENEEDFYFNYNMKIKDKKISIYNKDMSIKEEIEIPTDHIASTDVFYEKYMVISDTEQDSEKGRYFVYDENYNKIFNLDEKFNLILNENEDVYFVTNSNNSVNIYNKKGLITTVEEHIYESKTKNQKSGFIVLKRLNDNKYDVYDLKGKIILHGIEDYRYYSNLLIITKKIDDINNEYILLNKDIEIPIGTDENVISDKYIIVENIENKNIKLYDYNGKVLLDTVTGTKEKYNDKYIIVKNEDSYNVYDVNKGQSVFEYNKDDFVKIDEEMEIIKLKNGYYNYSGKKILSLD